MDSAVASASYPQLLVVLVVAEWLYLDWAESREEMPQRQIRRGWIDLHLGEAFRGWVQFVVDELDRVFPTDDNQGSEAETLARTWRQAVDLECAYFDNVYEN